MLDKLLGKLTKRSRSMQPVKHGAGAVRPSRELEQAGAALFQHEARIVNAGDQPRDQCTQMRLVADYRDHFPVFVRLDPLEELCQRRVGFERPGRFANADAVRLGDYCRRLLRPDEWTARDQVERGNQGAQAPCSARHLLAPRLREGAQVVVLLHAAEGLAIFGDAVADDEEDHCDRRYGFFGTAVRGAAEPPPEPELPLEEPADELPEPDSVEDRGVELVVLPPLCV